MSTTPSGADGGASPVAATAPAAEADGYAPPAPGPAPRRPYPGPFVRRGVAGGVVALVAAGTGVVGLVVGLAIGGATADRAAGTAAATDAGTAAGAELSAGLAVAGAPAPTPTLGAGSAEGVESGAASTAAEHSDQPTAEHSDRPAAEDSDRPAARALDDGEGSRDNPLPLGTPVLTPEWEVALGAPREAWEELRGENQFNDAPPAGMEYWMVPVTATYTGTETSHAATQLGVGFVGSDARTYSDMCGVIPDDLWDVDQVYGGGTATGNVCVVVPAGAHGLWTVTPGWSAEPVFFTGR